MSAFFFSIDWMALGVAVGISCLSYLLSIAFRRQSPQLAFSFLEGLSSQIKGRVPWAFFPQKLQKIAIISFLIAFIDPHLMLARDQFPSNKQNASKSRENLPPPTEGIAIYLALDQSGSMSAVVSAKDSSGIPRKIKKIDLLKQVTERFIQDQASNLIGLVAFARIPRVLAPLTLDQQTLEEQLKGIEVVKAQEEDGTSIGYAIFKTAHLIAATRHFGEELREQGTPAYEIKGAVIIVVTDGLQDPNPLDKGNRLRAIELEDAALYAKSQNIRLYIVNIDPTFASAEFAPHRRQMTQITGLTGGKFYLTSENQTLQQIYEEINQLEKGTVLVGDSQLAPQKDKNFSYKRLSFYPFFVALGLILLLTSVGLDTTILRQVP